MSREGPMTAVLRDHSPLSSPSIVTQRWCYCRFIGYTSTWKTYRCYCLAWRFSVIILECVTDAVVIWNQAFVKNKCVAW